MSVCLSWECMYIKLRAPADRLAIKQANQHAGTTNMASHEGNATRTLQKTLGTLRETQGMPIMLRHCQVTPGNTGNANDAMPLPRLARKCTAHNTGNTPT